MKLNTNLPEIKSEVLKYVSDVAEMELNAFTMEKIADDCLTRGETLQTNAQRKLNGLRSETENIEKVLNEAQAEFDKKNRSFKVEQSIAKNPLSGVFSSIWYGIIAFAISFIPAYIIMMVVGGVAKTAGSSNSGNLGLGAFKIVMALGTIGGFVGRLIYKKSEYNDIANKAKKETDIAEKELNSQKVIWNTHNQSIEVAEKELADAISARETMREQAEQNRKAAAEIRAQLKKCYELGVVPPDYRNLECVVGIKDNLKKSNVPNVRTAIKCYEEQVFNKQVQKGIEMIYKSWNKLSSSMSTMRSAMQQVQLRVIAMSNDIEMLSKDVSKGLDNRNKALENSKSIRYIAESVKNSQERTEWYLNNQD